MRTYQGIWTSQTTVVEPLGIQESEITIDKYKNIHLTWYLFNFDSIVGNIFYQIKSENGSWSQPVNVSNTGKAMGSNNIIADNQGTIYCIWEDDSLKGEIPFLNPQLLYRSAPRVSGQKQA
jgi:hypothetical protein